MRKGFAIAGALLLVIGIIGGIALFVGGFTSMLSQDPASNYECKITQSGSTMDLGRGDYEIWYDGWGPSSITIEGPNHQNIDIEIPNVDASINNRHWYGSFEIKSAGIYTITYQGSCTIYVTEPISMGLSFGIVFGGCCAGIFITIIGVVLLILGLVLKTKTSSVVNGSNAEVYSKRCPKCGKEVSKDISICPECFSNIY